MDTRQVSASQMQNSGQLFPFQFDEPNNLASKFVLFMLGQFINFLPEQKPCEFRYKFSC